jgi:hypothetical protein
MCSIEGAIGQYIKLEKKIPMILGECISSSTRGYNRHESRYNIYLLFILVLMLLWCSWTFSKDAHTLLLFPLERMMNKVKSIAAQPLLATKLADDEFEQEEKNKVKRRRKRDIIRFWVKSLYTRLFRQRVDEVKEGEDENEKEEQTNKMPLMETVILEKTIIKLGSLLAVGFGEAGSRVIEQNLSGGDSALVNVMVEGKRVETILGSVRILNFNVATEVMQANVYTFLNQIAEIVHGVATAHHGAPITSRGDTFLLAWRLLGLEDSASISVTDRTSVTAETSDAITDFVKKNDLCGRGAEALQQEALAVQQAVIAAGDLPKSKDSMSTRLSLEQRIRAAKESLVSRIADLSMIALAEMIGAIHTSRVLTTYREHPGMQQRLGMKCHVSLSGGLHCGWVIEGAVGSEFKVDPSYLSPNVSMVYSIERATQTYDVTLLVAESLVNILTPNMASYCRCIDHVLITGSNKPMDLYAIDLDTSGLEVEKVIKQIKYNAYHRINAKKVLDGLKQAKLDRSKDTVKDFWLGSQVIGEMRNRFTPDFIHLFEMGYQNYRLGEWEMAERLLSRTLTMLGTIDGPSNAILKFMEEHDFLAPETWAWMGRRELD